MGVAGLGGYAAFMTDQLLACSESAGGPVKLRAVCDPQAAAFGRRVAELEQRGVRVLERYEDLLAEPIEAVWLPLPIHLHRAFTEQALAAGKAVMCEKPAAGCVQDVDAMIAARDAAKLPVAIGFQHIYDPATLQLKRRLLDGGIGEIDSATLHACWPRDDAYYDRNTWAGAVQRDGVWVLDSPANNALSHYINLALFLLGSSVDESARLISVEAELYRGRPIENYDTISMRLTLEGDVPVVVLLTHACKKAVEPQIRIKGTDGTAVWQAEGQSVLASRSGEPMGTIKHAQKVHREMIERFAQLVRGQNDPTRTVATLETSRVQTQAINAASQAAAVRDVPASAVRVTASSGGAAVRAIIGIEQAFASCVEHGQTLHESGCFDWTRPVERLEIADGYACFTGPRAAKG